MLQNKRIAIVGGGPGGLTLARLLQMQQVDVKVYERDLNRDVRVQGATLDLHAESGLKALEAAGLLEEFKQYYRPGADQVRLVDQHGSVVYDQHASISGQDFGHAHFRPEIDRGPLRNLLLDSLEPGTVIWDSHLVSVQPVDSSWKLQFRNGETAVADILIGADGAHSMVRPIVTPIQPVYSGITMIDATIYDAERHAPQIHALLKGGKIFALGESQTLIVSSKDKGEMSFYTGCRTDASWVRDCGLDFSDNRQVLAWFKQEFSHWSPIWEELFAHEQTRFIPRPQYYLPLDQSWETQSNITLLGDAAHVMPPFAGEGVNMAMRDALELSRRLTDVNCTDLTTAIRNYETQMWARAAETTRMTLEQTESMHAPGALKQLLEMFRG